MLTINRIGGSQWWWRGARGLAHYQRPISTTRRWFFMSKDLSDVRVDRDVLLS